MDGEHKDKGATGTVKNYKRPVNKLLAVKFSLPEFHRCWQKMRFFSQKQTILLVIVIAVNRICLNPLNPNSHRATRRGPSDPAHIVGYILEH